jgi:hypothetical protein
MQPDLLAIRFQHKAKSPDEPEDPSELFFAPAVNCRSRRMIQHVWALVKWVMRRVLKRFFPRNQPHRDTLLTSLGAATLFALLAVVMTWPRLPTAGTTVVDYGDPLSGIWRFRWIDYAIASDFAHLYDAPIFRGYPSPLAYDNITIGPALVARSLSLLTGSLELAYNLMVVASFGLAAFCAFLLARHVTGSVTAGLVGGLVFSFWSYTFAHISHITDLSLYPIPLALLCLHRIFEAPSRSGSIAATQAASLARRLSPGPAFWAAGFCACFVWQSLHSFYYAAYLALLAGMLALWEALVVRRWLRWTQRARWSAAISLLVACSVSGAALALLSAPYREVQAQMGLYRTRDEQIAWSAHLTDYLSVSPRNNTYKGVLPNVWPEPLFPGFASLALGTTGLAIVAIKATRRRDAHLADDGGRQQGELLGYYTLVAVGALVLSLGPVWRLGGSDVPLPYSVLGVLPGFNGLRAPGRLASVAALGWGVLAGWAWLHLIRLARGRNSADEGSHAPRPARKATILRSSLATLALLSIMCIEQWTVPTPTAPLPPKRAGSLLPQGKAPPVYNWLAMQQDNGVLAEFPVSTDAASAYIRMYYQGDHDHPLLNGHSSFVPPVYPEVARLLDEPVEVGREWVGILQSLDVRYISFYHWAYKESNWQRKMKSLTAFPEIQPAGEFEEDRVYKLAPLDEAALPRLGWRLPEAVPAGSTVPITVTVTNVYTYPLLTRLHTYLPLEVRWRKMTANGAASPERTMQIGIDTPLLLDQGAHLFPISIVTPLEPGLYHLDLRVTWPIPIYKPNPSSEIMVKP